MSKTERLANLYVATLRAMYLIIHHCHLTTRGDNFYGSHLLFSKIYTQIVEDIDTAAEKFIGLFGINALDFALQQEFISKLLAKYQAKSEEQFQLALAIEEDFLAFSEQAYKLFDEEGVLTLGLDNDLQSISSHSEQAMYLLQQSLDKE
jgi:DNA-binding ferritin-like protein